MHDCAYTLRETPFWWFEQPLADKVQLWLETNLIHAPQHGIYRSDQLWVMISLFYLEFVKLIEAGEIFWVHADPHFGIGTNIARAAQSQQWWSMCQLERLGSAFRDNLAKIKPDWSPTSNTIRSSLGECFVNSSTSLNFLPVPLEPAWERRNWFLMVLNNGWPQQLPTKWSWPCPNRTSFDS